MKITIERRELPKFKAFCMEKGWVEVPPQGDWELLRMRHPDASHPALVHFRKREELGLTLHGESAKLWRRFAMRSAQ